MKFPIFADDHIRWITVWPNSAILQNEREREEREREKEEERRVKVTSRQNVNHKVFPTSTKSWF